MRSRQSPSLAFSSIDRFFSISARGSTIGREVRGGVVTFFTMAYIIVLNPLIIGTVPDVDGRYLGGGAQPNLAAVAAATSLVAGLLTIAMGALANFPLALAAGLGLNAFVAFSIASQMTWADAMGLVVIEGVLILLLVLGGFRKAVFAAVPAQLKVAIGVGIGLFIALIGFVDAGFVRRTQAPPVPVEFAIGGQLRGWPLGVFVVGVLLIAVLLIRQIKGALLIGIVAATMLAILLESIFDIGPSFVPPDEFNPVGWGLNVPAIPDRAIEAPDLILLGNFSLLGSFERVGLVAAALLIFTLMMADFFDTMGTMVAVGSEAGLIAEDGMPAGAQRILIVDSVAAAAGGMGAVSSNTSYIESAAGVGEGARTGLASVVTGTCFLLSMLLAPLVNVIPYEAATPALIIVGFLMMTQVTEIDWNDFGIAFPAFLIMVLMPFSYSVSVGIGAGFVGYAVLAAARGRAREVHPLMWLVSVLFVVYFGIALVEKVLGVG